MKWPTILTSLNSLMYSVGNSRACRNAELLAAYRSTIVGSRGASQFLSSYWKKFAVLVMGCYHSIGIISITVKGSRRSKREISISWLGLYTANGNFLIAGSWQRDDKLVRDRILGLTALYFYRCVAVLLDPIGSLDILEIVCPSASFSRFNQD